MSKVSRSRTSLVSPLARTLARRDVLQLLGAPLVGAHLWSFGGLTQLRAAEEFEPLNRFPRMVHEHFVRQVRAAERRHLRRLEQLETKADAERYVDSARARIREAFGPEPERTPLNPRVTGVVERGTYRIEKIIFDSRPGFPVTANLYLPEDTSEPVPGVVGTCGHSSNGKAAEAYQAFAQGLARLGCACLIYDPIGQGERLQYVKDDLSPRMGIGVAEHLHAGNQQFLVGEFLGMWRAWDGIRALDYLLSRPEVDGRRVGVTGNSGGGTMTTWLSGVDQRWAMSAPSCFVTTFRRNLENELPADTEQCPPRALALDLDHDDFLAALAPRPVIVLAKERDYFDVRGSEEVYQRLKKLYGLLGAEDNVALFVGPTGHGYSQENREAMYSWFGRAAGKSPASEPTNDAAAGYDGTLTATAEVPFVAEPDITIEPDETLWCTPAGQVAGLEGTRTVFAFTRDRSQDLASTRGNPRGDDLRAAIHQVLKLPRTARPTPDYRIWRYLGSRGYPTPQAVSYAVTTQPGVQAIVYRLTDERWYSRPPQAGQRALLYVAHLSSDEELRTEPLIREVMEAAPEVPLFTCDVRGIGESMPDTCGPNSFHSTYGSDYFYAIHSLMLDRPYLGQKTWDVLRVVDWLASLGHTDVHIVASGWGALPATFAAVLSERIRQVTLKHALTSYSDVAQTEDYDWPLSCLLPNVLAHFDLPDCYAELQTKKLRQLEPWNAREGRSGKAE